MAEALAFSNAEHSAQRRRQAAALQRCEHASFDLAGGSRYGQERRCNKRRTEVLRSVRTTD
jgi:hypothetical protein